MIDKNEDPLDIHFLQATAAPPPELEDRIVSLLRKENLIAPNSRQKKWKRILPLIAASLIIFTAGMLYQKFRGGSSKAVSMSDSTFVLFLWEGPEYVQPNNPEQMQERIEAYRNWAIGVRKEGIPISGTKLRDEKSMLGTVQGDEKEAISGYFLIDAPSAQQAFAIAEKCPHLRYGGKIEIRRVHPV